MEKQPHQDKMHLHKDSLFYHERLCQHVPFFKQTKPSTSMTDACKTVITTLLFPRLVIVRARHVLAALMPILNLEQDGAFGVILQGVGVVLSPIGWVLHGLRLLINVIELLQQAMLSAETNDTDKTLTWHERVGGHALRCSTAIGNDLIWMIAAIVPESLVFTCVFLIVDVLWLSGRAWLKMQRLNALPDGVDSITDSHLLLEQTKKSAEEWQVFLLNLASVLSISAITIMKNFILPTFFPILALNPLVLLAFSVLSLAITITCHLLEKAWVESSSCDEKKEKNKITTLPFFGELHPSNEEDMAQSMNLTCAR